MPVPTFSRTLSADWAPQSADPHPPMRHRSLFLSDMHLGARMCRPEQILAFLDAHCAETIYLVGDIVDNWQPLAKNWAPAHHAVLRRLLALPQTGARVVYVPGNHDAYFRAFAGATFDGIEVALDAVHTTADGRRLLVTHGDQCDVFSRRAPILARAGSLIESSARAIDAGQRRATTALGLRQWTGITRHIAQTNALIRRHDRFEERLCALARAHGADGIVCGHFHQPALHDHHGPLYANCGDWAEHGSAVAEGFDGRLSLMVAPVTSAAPGTYPDDALVWAT